MATQPGAIKKTDRDSKSLKKYFRGVRSEFKKVVWPSKKELLSYSGVVIVVSIVASILIAILDYILRLGLSFFLG